MTSTRSVQHPAGDPKDPKNQSEAKVDKSAAKRQHKEAQQPMGFSRIENTQKRRIL